MTPQEKRDLARRLAEGWDLFDFKAALEVVEHNPAEVEEIIKEREESKRALEELERANQRLKIAAREFR
ncbi:MAG TPA: hypothetical protein VF009_01780 [Solirubrobacterales bacterium]